jgi:tetratricopeptide (TPR) repeat protein
MGNIYTQKKHYPQALEEFKSILSLDKKNPSAHYNLGCIYYIQNMRPNAEYEWKRVIEFEKTKQTTPRKTGSDSNLTYTYLVPKKSFTFLAYSALGKLYFETGKQKQAKEEFSMAARLDPDQPESYLYLSKIYRLQDMLELARHNLKRYLYLGGEKTEEVARMIIELNIQE